MLNIWLAMGGWLAGWLLLGRDPNIDAAQMRDNAFECGPVPMKPFAIIIPARNEENTLPRLLASINQQQLRPEELLVVDDNSTDNTAAAARSAGATVLCPGSPPPGWQGKPWACHRGAAATTAPHLLFLDADTWFEPGGLARIVDWAAVHGGVISVMPFHVVPTWREQLSAFFNLLMVAGVGAACWPHSSVGLFGQMLLIDRDTYVAAGGHARVRRHVLENVHLAQQLRSGRVPLRCLLGRGSLSIRMYPDSVADLVGGWSKGFASGAAATSGALLLLSIVWLSGAVIAAANLLQARTWLAATVYVAYALQLYLFLRRLGSFRLLTALLYPIPLLFFFAVFANSIARAGKPVSWKGRAVRAD